MQRALCFTLLLAGAAFSVAQSPRCLVGQPLATNGSAILDLMNPLANELDATGQVSCVTYGIEDPLIRQAFLENRIARPEKLYKIDEVLTAAKALSIPFVAWIDAQNTTLKGSNQKVLLCHLVMYKNGKKVWEDSDTQGLNVGSGANMDDTIHSVMSSLNTKLQEGPFKGMAKSPKAGDGGIGKGQSPVIPDTNDDDPTLNDWNAIQEKVKEKLAEGKRRAAETMLRDAIDAAPTDPVRRKALIDLLQGSVDTIDAAVEVTIAAAEALGDPSMITKAARILIDNDKIDRANEIVKDAIVSQPNNPEVQLLQAELQLRTSKPDQALAHVENALKVKGTAEGFLLRAICRALLGSAEGAKLDIERATKENPQILSTNYIQIASIVDSALEVEGPDLRSLVQKAELKRTADEVTEGLDAQDRMAKACLLLFGENAMNPKFEKSHGIRLLALNLLVQTIAELRHFSTQGDAGSLSDAKNDIAEIVKTLAEAKEAFSKDRTDARIDHVSG